MLGMLMAMAMGDPPPGMRCEVIPDRLVSRQFEPVTGEVRYVNPGSMAGNLRDDDLTVRLDPVEGEGWSPESSSTDSIVVASESSVVRALEFGGSPLIWMQVRGDHMLRAVSDWIESRSPRVRVVLWDEPRLTLVQTRGSNVVVQDDRGVLREIGPDGSVANEYRFEALRDTLQWGFAPGGPQLWWSLDGVVQHIVDLSSGARLEATADMIGSFEGRVLLKAGGSFVLVDPTSGGNEVLDALPEGWNVHLERPVSFAWPHRPSVMAWSEADRAWGEVPGRLRRANEERAIYVEIDERHVNLYRWSLVDREGTVLLSQEGTWPLLSDSHLFVVRGNPIHLPVGFDRHAEVYDLEAGVWLDRIDLMSGGGG